MAAPWRTLRHAVAQLRPGDTLYLRGGIYAGSQNTIDSARATVPRGTSWSNAITIAGHPGESVIIRPQADLNGIRLTVGAPAYLVFQDFVIDMADSTGNGSEPEGIYLSDGANHNRFQRLEVRNGGSFGITFSKNNGNSGFNEVLNSKVHNTGNGRGDPRNGHGFYISTSDNLIEGNDIYGNAGYGIHLYDDAGPKFVARNVIRGNTIYNNGGGRSAAYGLVVAWGDANLIANNTIYGNPGGIFVYVDSSNTQVVGNLIRSNFPLEGILVQSASSTVLRNNEVVGNGLGIVDNGTGTLLSGNRDR
jgi:parallel beta-helix repeat protein